MKRYLLAKIIQVNDPDLGPTWTTAVSRYASSGWVQMIPTDADGKPRFDWALVVVSATDLTAHLADADIVALPEGELNKTVGATVATTVRATLGARGVNNTGIGADTTLRTILRRIGQHLSKDFDESLLDIGDG